MSGLEVRRFAAGDIADAGGLLAQRHRRHRLAVPLLPAGFESAERATAELAEVFAAENASGAVASRDGRIIGYVIGAPKSSPVWGDNVWVESSGQAVTDAEVMRDLYALAATEWVERGYRAHYVLVPATDAPLIDAWFRLGFGNQHVHAIRALPEKPGGHDPKTGGVRRAVRADIPVLARLDRELPLHQGLAPAFSAGRVPSLDDSVAEWESDLDSPDYANFVIERDGQVIGLAVGCALEKSSSHIGPARVGNAAFLGFAAVFPHARGLGAGRALAGAVLTWAAESGFDSIVTDWRATNLLSSRTWPALGFEPSFLRLHRLIGY